MAQTAQARLKQQKRFDDRFAQQDAVVDADFETVAGSSGSGPSKNDYQRVTSSEVAPEKFEAGQGQTDKTGMSVFGKKSIKALPDDIIAFYGFGSVLVMLSFWVFGGHTLFRDVDMTPTGSIQSVQRSIEIAEPSWRVVSNDRRSALHVEAIVRNTGKAAVHTKPVTVTVKHNDGSTKRYLLGQNGWTLGPGQEVVVSSRLDIASAGIASVIIALND